VHVEAWTGTAHLTQRGSYGGQAFSASTDVSAALVEVVQDHVELANAGPNSLRLSATNHGKRLGDMSLPEISSAMRGAARSQRSEPLVTVDDELVDLIGPLGQHAVTDLGMYE